jgi:hypothetical protein
VTSPEDLERQHTLATAVARLEELRLREVLAGRDALAVKESLELLALSEVIARKVTYGRQLTVQSARAAGASWSDIGRALGLSKQAASDAHLQWIESLERDAAGEVGEGPDGQVERDRHD